MALGRRKRTVHAATFNHHRRRDNIVSLRYHQTVIATSDSLIERMAERLGAGEQIPEVVTDIYAKALQGEARPLPADTFTRTAINTVGAFVPPVGAAVVLGGAFRDDEPQQRAFAKYLAVVSGLGMVGRAAGLDSRTLQCRLVLQSAIAEFERARSLSIAEGLHDIFALALIEAFAAARMYSDGTAAEFARPAVSYLEQVVEEITADISRLESEEKAAQRAVDSVRSSFSEEQINQSYAKSELGMISRDAPMAFSREPVSVLTYGYAQLGNVVALLEKLRKRLEMYQTALLRVTNVLGAA
jgi:hypothetical protein